MVLKAATVLAAATLMISGSLVNTIAVECPKDFTEILGNCFLFLNKNQTDWHEARALCAEYGADLAIINDCNVFAAVVRHIHINGLEVPPRFSYWLGGTDAGDEGSWYWINQTPMAMGLPFWGSLEGNTSEPSGGEAQNCAQMYHDDRYYFHDGECDKASYPLCQAGEPSGPSYCGTPDTE